MAEIVLDNVTKRYGDVAAVEGLSLDVEPGELVSLLGPSGCGKTTTLRLVAGFLQPESGEIWVGERCLSSPSTVVPPERRRMAMIFQSYALWPHMTVAQNVAYGLRFKRGVSRIDRDRRQDERLMVHRRARGGHGFEQLFLQLDHLNSFLQQVVPCGVITQHVDVPLLHTRLRGGKESFEHRQRFCRRGHLSI